MADGSKQAKQTGPEAEQPSQVSGKWERSGEQGWVLNLNTLSLTIEPSDEGLDWSAMVEVPNGAEHLECFDSLEEAKRYCEEKAKELLRKDLERLGGGENITLPIKRTRTPGVRRLRLGEFDLNQDDGSSGVGELFLHAAGTAMIVRMPNGGEFTIDFSAVVSSLAALAPTMS